MHMKRNAFMFSIVKIDTVSFSLLSYNSEDDFPVNQNTDSYSWHPRYGLMYRFPGDAPRMFFLRADRVPSGSFL